MKPTKPLSRDEVIDLMEQSASKSRKFPLDQMMRKCEQLCKQYLDLLNALDIEKDDYR